MSLGHAALIAGAAVVASTINTVAGGGSLISFPTLLALGYGSVAANVTNNVALLPGYAGGMAGYRRELEGQRARAKRLGAVSALGGAAGAALLLVLPPGVFEAVVPFLILAACALLALRSVLERHMAGRAHPRVLDLVAFGVSVYGGYFGAAFGIAVISFLGLALPDDFQRLNALKSVLQTIVAGVAAVAFALFGPVHWGAVAIMALASLAGGQIGALVARRLPTSVLRAIVVVFGVAVAIRLLTS